jgi:hypothetical protein
MVCLPSHIILYGHHSDLTTLVTSELDLICSGWTGPGKKHPKPLGWGDIEIFTIHDAAGGNATRKP